MQQVRARAAITEDDTSKKKKKKKKSGEKMDYNITENKKEKKNNLCILIRLLLLFDYCLKFFEHVLIGSSILFFQDFCGLSKSRVVMPEGRR